MIKYVEKDTCIYNDYITECTNNYLCEYCKNNPFFISNVLERKVEQISIEEIIKDERKKES